MSNPARDLHVLYRGWKQAVPATGTSMTAVVNPLVDGHADVMRAFRLLQRIDGLLRALEEDGQQVAVFRRQFPSWTAPVLAHPHGWEKSVRPAQAVTNSILDQLESVAAFLDGKVYVLADDDEKSLRDTVEKAQRLLAADETLDDALRIYIHRLLQSIRNALEDDAVGAGFDAAEAAMHLLIALRAAEGTSTTSSGAWRDIWTQFLAGIASGALLQGGTTIMRAITGG